uniref:HTH arsR-type domain-containing protein n=1 Tax=Cyprinus carpio carpio TaxID=630221 RepID=A0A9J7XES4_CYPCA
MGKTADLTAVQKAIIDTLKREDKTQKEISERIGCSQSAVSRHLSGKSVGRKKYGKKRCTTRRGDRTLRKIVEKDRFQTLGDLRKQWTESGVETSRATVHRRFCRCFWFKSTRLCTVALDVSTPDSVHCFRRSPKVWNRSFSTIFLRVWSPLLVVQRFLPHFFLPTDFPLRCLDTALWEQPIRSEISFCVLPSRLRVSMMAFWVNFLPMIAVLSNEPGWEFLKASGIFCRCLELIS